MPEQRQRGHPRRDPIQVLFTRLWLSALKVKSGLHSAGAIEERLEPHRVQRHPEGVTRPRKYDGYDDGRRVPQRGSERGDPVELAEAEFPGTARFFDSPMKQVLLGQQVSLEWVHDRLLALDRPVVELLFAGQTEPTAHARQLRSFSTLAADRLVRIGGLAALEAAVLLMKWGELTHSPSLRAEARRAYIALQPSVRRSPEVAPLADALFLAIDVKFPFWLYVRPHIRYELTQYTSLPTKQLPLVTHEDAGPGLAFITAFLRADVEALDKLLPRPRTEPLTMDELFGPKPTKGRFGGPGGSMPPGEN